MKNELKNKCQMIDIEFERKKAILTAICIFATNIRIRATFIDIHTDRALWFKAILTEALTFNALGICCAVEVTLTQNIHVDLFTSNFWIWPSSIALRTPTIVAGICIFADSRWRTWLFESCTFVNIRTSFVRISRVIWFART